MLFRKLRNEVCSVNTIRQLLNFNSVGPYTCTSANCVLEKLAQSYKWLLCICLVWWGFSPTFYTKYCSNANKFIIQRGKNSNETRSLCFIFSHHEQLVESNPFIYLPVLFVYPTKCWWNCLAWEPFSSFHYFLKHIIKMLSSDIAVLSWKSPMCFHLEK